MALEAPRFRPSKEILADIKTVTSTLIRANALIRKYTREVESLTKEKNSLNELIKELSDIIENTGGTREQIQLLAQYIKRRDEVQNLIDDDKQRKDIAVRDSVQSNQELDSLQKELEETLTYEAELKIRLTQTIVVPKNATNTLLLPTDRLTIPAGTEIELLSYDGDNYIKIGSIPEPIGKIEFKDIDYSKIFIDSGMRAEPAVVEHLLGESRTEFFLHHMITYNFDLVITLNTPFILFDDEYNHSDGTIWTLVRGLS